MESPNERLKFARLRAGFTTAAKAADAMGIPRPTYMGHENGHRGFPAKRAPQYGRKFKVSAEWLLYGTGEMDLGEARSEEAEILDYWSRVSLEDKRTVKRMLRAMSDGGNE